MELSPGAKLGPYEVLSRLGVGGMGEVWKARDPRLDRIVAIKTSHAKFSDSSRRRPSRPQQQYAPQQQQYAPQQQQYAPQQYNGQ